MLSGSCRQVDVYISLRYTRAATVCVCVCVVGMIMTCEAEPADHVLNTDLLCHLQLIQAIQMVQLQDHGVMSE